MILLFVGVLTSQNIGTVHVLDIYDDSHVDLLQYTTHVEVNLHCTTNTHNISNFRAMCCIALKHEEMDM
jgi:hypothetical protein